MKKSLKIVFLCLIAAFALLQFVPVKRDNPPGPDTFTAPADVKAIVKKACYDCHSNSTKWPWYAHVAPASWTAASHVREARARLNLSNWARMTAEKQKRKSLKIADEIEEGGMPLPMYLKMHPEARLSEKEKQTIAKWARGLNDHTDSGR
jgi:cytochrome c551/c552